MKTKLTVNEKNIVLSKKDIKKLRNVYQNYTIPIEYLTLDVKSIMDSEGISKYQAINKILKILKY